MAKNNKDLIARFPIEDSSLYDERQWTIPDRDMAYEIPFEDIDSDILEYYGLTNPDDLVAMGVPRRRKVGQEIIDRLIQTGSFGKWDPGLRHKTEGITSTRVGPYGASRHDGGNIPAHLTPPGYGPHGYYDEDIAQTAKDTLWIDQPQSLFKYAINKKKRKR